MSGSVQNGYSIIVREIHCGICDNYGHFDFVMAHDDPMTNTTAALSTIAREIKAAGWRQVKGKTSCPRHRRQQTRA